MDISIKAGFAIMALGVGLTGCAGFSDPSVGQGPITLSTDAEKAFADYRAQPKPRYFAVSADGSAFYYSYCSVERCLRQAKTTVIEKCETYSDGVPCKIYGSHGVVVWSEGAEGSEES